MSSFNSQVPRPDESRASSESSYDPATAFLDQMQMSTGPSQSGTKRRWPGAYNDDDDDDSGPKRSRTTAQDRSRQLPAEIWQHIFTYVPPRILARLLAVCRQFRGLLDPAQSGISKISPDDIWQSSRRLFWPRVPAPLRGRSELDMWRVVCSATCQFCGLRNRWKPDVAKDPWKCGPGQSGVSTVFAFAVVSCGRCLVQRALSEVDLLLSATPSVLMPGLSAIFVTPELHVVPPHVIQTDPEPSKRGLTKFYWTDQVNDIKADFEAARALGPAATEEWLKGVDSLGKSVRADVARWERWEASGGTKQMRMHLSQRVQEPPPPRPTISTYGNSTLPKGGRLEPAPQRETMTQFKGLTRDEIRKTKKDEVERRARQLDPSLTLAVLSQLSSYHHALLSPAPLDEKAWEQIRLQLLAAKSQNNPSNTASSKSTAAPSNGHADAAAGKDVKRATDEEWDEAQGPVRTRIAGYADDIIRDRWKSGQKISKNNCTQFAAGTLVSVRKMFYDAVAADAAAAIAAGRRPPTDPPAGPWTQKLTLENMRWVFDVKIKPLTDNFRKDLFLCNGCPVNPKHYLFGAVVQHYAAKHTDVLSRGNIVVDWRAEWPETPPFRPDGKIASGPTEAAPQTKTMAPKEPPQPTTSSSTTQRHSDTVHHPTAVAALPVEVAAARMPGHVQNANRVTDESQGQVMVQVAKSIWLRIGHIEGLDAAIKLCVVIHHIAKEFERVSESPMLHHFHAALAEDRDMRPICELRGLRCNPCTVAGASSHVLYTALELTRHFLDRHMENAPIPLDWRTHMVMLPDMPILADLPRLLARDRAAYAEVADALPWAFGDTMAQWRGQPAAVDVPDSHRQGTYYVRRPLQAVQPEGYPASVAPEELLQQYDPRFPGVATRRYP